MEWLVEVFGSFPYQNTNHCSETPEGHMSLRTYVLLQKVAGMVCRGIWRLPVSKPQSLQRNPRRTYVPKDICPFIKSSWNGL